MPEIKNITQFSKELESCNKRVKAIDPAFKDRMIKSIEAQLEYLKTWIKKGYDLDDPKLEELNFGLLAGKSVDDIDEQLGEDLLDLANYIDDIRDGEKSI